MKTKAPSIGLIMISEQQFVEKWRNLTPAKQQQVIHFVERLELQNSEENVESVPDLPTIEIWSPYDSHAAAQDLLKLLEDDPGEDLD
jgi:choline kinase